jgi:hypothetical protein
MMIVLTADSFEDFLEGKTLARLLILAIMS